MLALQLACAQTSDVTLLVFMKQLKALTALPDVCSAARMRPDPDLPAFSMAPPARVAQALLQYLALLLSALCQRHLESRMIQSFALSASRRAERTAQQGVQQKLTSTLVAAAVAKELSHAPYREMHGRPVPAGLPLQLKLNEATVKDFVGEFVAVISIWTCVHQTCRLGNGFEACEEASLLHMLLQNCVEHMRLPKLFELMLKEKSMCPGLC